MSVLSLLLKVDTKPVAVSFCLPATRLHLSYSMHHKSWPPTVKLQ